jgi:hypothetical protein
VGMAAVMFLSSTLPQLVWIRDGRNSPLLPKYPILPELISYHLYWLVPFILLVAGIMLFSQNPKGYVPAMAVCVFFWGAKLIFLFLSMIRMPGFIAELLLSTMGLQFEPPLLKSLAIIFLNVATIVVLVNLNKWEVRKALPVQPQMTTVGILAGIGMIVYAFICHYVGEALRAEPFLDFQF